MVSHLLLSSDQHLQASLRKQTTTIPLSQPFYVALTRTRRTIAKDINREILP